ncbi:MAG TPA: FliH/SctL family protein [Candidatus Hydrogenedens sp.]|nr:FliH/SctL family protein [Candidatus Hydrogenedens sp.]
MSQFKKTQKVIAENAEVKFLSRDDLKEFPKEREISDDPLSIYSPEELRTMILEQAQQEAEKIKQKAYEEGYNEGKLLAEQEFQQFLEETNKILQESIEKITQARTNFLEQITPQILKLVFQISEKVISAQVQTNSDIVKTIVKETLEQFIDSQEISLHIHPDDYSIIEDEIKSRIGDENIMQKVIWVPDERIERGGCIAETKTQFLDNQISSRLELIVEKIVSLARENGVDI